MKILEHSHPNDEPVIFSLEAYRNAVALADDDPPDPPDDKKAKVNEYFWAGWNHAMRRSARWAG